VVAVVGLFICQIVLGPVALFLAASAKRRVDQSGGQVTGEGLVVAARVIGVADIVIGVFVLAWAASRFANG